MDKRAAKQDVKADSAAVRHILLAWDPIGSGYAPTDEYDCLVDHVVSALYRGRTTTDEIAAVISSELTNHFGIAEPLEAIREVAGQVVTSWNTRHG